MRQIKMISLDRDMITLESIQAAKIRSGMTVNGELLTEDAKYDKVIEELNKARQEGKTVDEGLLGAVVGGIAGATIIPSIMKAICKVLGINVNGQFGNLLTSRLVLAAVGAEIGWNK